MINLKSSFEVLSKIIFSKSSKRIFEFCETFSLSCSLTCRKNLYNHGHMKRFKEIIDLPNFLSPKYSNLADFIFSNALI